MTQLPVHYHIRVKAVPDRHWSAWFDRLQVTSDASGHTTIAGPVPDQAALQGCSASSATWAWSRWSHAAAPLTDNSTWRHEVQQMHAPRRERRPPRRRQLRVAGRQRQRRPKSLADRRTPSGRLLPY